MAGRNVYIDLDDREIPLAGLDAAERQLLAGILKRARTRPDWGDFDHYWVRAVSEFYDARGVPRKVSSESAVYRVAEDLSDRLAVASGMARIGDYRDELEELIRERFATRRQFCEATGLSEDMLSHVMSGRKHLSIEALSNALDRIGYRLRILPNPENGSAASNNIKARSPNRAAARTRTAPPRASRRAGGNRRPSERRRAKTSGSTRSARRS